MILGFGLIFLNRCCSKSSAFCFSLLANWFGTFISFDCEDRDWSNASTLSSSWGAFRCIDCDMRMMSSLWDLMRVFSPFWTFGFIIGVKFYWFCCSSAYWILFWSVCSWALTASSCNISFDYLLKSGAPAYSVGGINYGAKLFYASALSFTRSCYICEASLKNWPLKSRICCRAYWYIWIILDWSSRSLLCISCCWLDIYGAGSGGRWLKAGGKPPADGGGGPLDDGGMKAKFVEGGMNWFGGGARWSYVGLLEMLSLRSPLSGSCEPGPVYNGAWVSAVGNAGLEATSWREKGWYAGGSSFTSLADSTCCLIATCCYSSLVWNYELSTFLGFAS